MKNKLYIGLGILLFTAFLLVGVLSVFDLTQTNSFSRQLHDLRSNTTQAEQIKELQQQLKESQDNNAKLSAQIGDMQKQLSDLQSEMVKIQQTKASGKNKVAYLTFDDGPSNITPRLLDVLKQNNVHATFFIVGTAASEYPQHVKRAYSEGHVIGIHSWTHDYAYIYKSEANFFEDFNRLKNYISGLVGEAPLVSRYPGGTNNTVSQHYSDHIVRRLDPQVKAMGIKPYDWNAYAGDAESGPKPAPDVIVRNVMKSAGPNNLVVLFHDTAVNSNDIAAMPEIIAQLRAKGYKFGVLSPLSADCQYKPF